MSSAIARLALPDSVQQCLHADAAAAADALAQDVAERLRQALQNRPQASLVLSGGRSPIAFLQRLSQQALAWEQVIVSIADERWVDASDADSNEHLLREHLLRNAAAGARFVPLKSEQAQPEQGIDTVEARLLAMPRPFDVLVLGCGDDGHTASLFPDAEETPAALVSTRLVAAIHPKSAAHPRITMTLPALLAARHIFVSISGDSKKAAIERAVASTPPLPIGRVLLQSPVPVRVYWSA